MSGDPLDILEEHLVALERMGFDDDPPAAPDLAGLVLTVDDLERAESMLERLAAAEQRVRGLQRRVLGEIAGARRPRRDAARPSPRVLDTQA